MIAPARSLLEQPMAVFVTGDESRSEESMPMLAAMLERDFGARHGAVRRKRGGRIAQTT
ncbi:MAG: hypothetical protein R3F17_17180 [Planctomycetota bacterium]